MGQRLIKTMSAATYFSFLLTCFVIELTPGPNMAYLAVLSASDGRKAGFSATLGIALGLLIIGVAAALGVAALIQSSTLAYQTLRWAGIGYLLYLAWDGWREEPENSPAQPPEKHKELKFFRRGLIVNLLNPKAAVFYIAILPGFIVAGVGVTTQALLLTLSYVSIATAIHSIIVLLAGTARVFLEDKKKRLIVRRILSITLTLIALWFAWETA